MSANLFSFPTLLLFRKIVCVCVCVCVCVQIHTIFKHVCTYLKHIQILMCTEHRSTSKIVERWVIE